MKAQDRITKRRTRRKFRIRNQVRKTGRLRLSVNRSNNNIYAQIIDDVEGKTLVSANTMESSVGGAGKYTGNLQSATEIGKLIATRANEKGITEVAFDRGSYRYHGRVKALADSARENGLTF